MNVKQSVCLFKFLCLPSKSNKLANYKLSRRSLISESNLSGDLNCEVSSIFNGFDGKNFTLLKRVFSLSSANLHVLEYVREAEASLSEKRLSLKR